MAAYPTGWRRDRWRILPCRPIPRSGMLRAIRHRAGSPITRIPPALRRVPNSVPPVPRTDTAVSPTGAPVAPGASHPATILGAAGVRPGERDGERRLGQGRRPDRRAAQLRGGGARRAAGGAHPRQGPGDAAVDGGYDGRCGIEILLPPRTPRLPDPRPSTAPPPPPPAPRAAGTPCPRRLPPPRRTPTAGPA